MVLSVLPVNSDPNQTFECSLPIDDKNRRFRFFFEWNPIGEYWQFDLYDLNQGGKQLLNKQVVCSIDYPYNNILKTYTYKELGSLYVISLLPSKDRPGYNNLGTDYVLVWGDTPDVQSIS